MSQVALVRCQAYVAPGLVLLERWRHVRVGL